MPFENKSALALGCLIFSVAILSGPLVSGIDLTSERSGPDNSGIDFKLDDGSGNITTNTWSGKANVNVKYVPTDSIRFTEKQYDTVHILRAPKAVVDVSDVEGEPILVYELDIPALQFSSLRIRVLDQSSERKLTMELLPSTVDSERLTQDNYNGVVRFRIRGDNPGIIYEQNVTVEVES